MSQEQQAHKTILNLFNTHQAEFDAADKRMKGMTNHLSDYEDDPVENDTLDRSQHLSYNSYVTNSGPSEDAPTAPLPVKPRSLSALLQPSPGSVDKGAIKKTSISGLLSSHLEHSQMIKTGLSGSASSTLNSSNFKNKLFGNRKTKSPLLNKVLGTTSPGQDDGQSKQKGFSASSTMDDYEGASNISAQFVPISIPEECVLGSNSPPPRSKLSTFKSSVIGKESHLHSSIYSSVARGATFQGPEQTKGSFDNSNETPSEIIVHAQVHNPGSTHDQFDNYQSENHPKGTRDTFISEEPLTDVSSSGNRNQPEEPSYPENIFDPNDSEIEIKSSDEEEYNSDGEESSGDNPSNIASDHNQTHQENKEPVLRPVEHEACLPSLADITMCETNLDQLLKTQDPIPNEIDELMSHWGRLVPNSLIVKYVSREWNKIHPSIFKMCFDDLRNLRADVDVQVIDYKWGYTLLGANLQRIGHAEIDSLKAYENLSRLIQNVMSHSDRTTKCQMDMVTRSSQVQITAQRSIDEILGTTTKSLSAVKEIIKELESYQSKIMRDMKELTTLKESHYQGDCQLPNETASESDEVIEEYSSDNEDDPELTREVMMTYGGRKLHVSQQEETLKMFIEGDVNDHLIKALRVLKQILMRAPWHEVVHHKFKPVNPLIQAYGSPLEIKQLIG